MSGRESESELPVSGDGACLGIRAMTRVAWIGTSQEAAVAPLRTTVLLSCEGVLDGRSGQAICSRVLDLFELSVEPILIDLSGVEAVDDDGVRYLTQMLHCADILGGVVAVLDTSEAIEDYVGHVEAHWKGMNNGHG